MNDKIYSVKKVSGRSHAQKILRKVLPYLINNQRGVTCRIIVK